MKMTLKTAAMVVLAVVCAAFAGSAAEGDRTGPRLEIASDRFDFGKVSQGEQAVHVFEFRNGGDDTLIIQKIQTS